MTACGYLHCHRRRWVIANISVMNYNQYRKARKLLNECCNYDNGQCLMLETICAQSISRTLLCNWFKEAVLPLDKELSATLLHKHKAKQCIICGKSFIAGSNRAKYCFDCSVMERKRKEAARQRKRYQSTHLEKRQTL